jgi:hypothetical protein
MCLVLSTANLLVQEYGLTQLEKLAIAQGICAPLLRKIRSDLQRNISESDAESETNGESVNRLNPRYMAVMKIKPIHIYCAKYWI